MVGGEGDDQFWGSGRGAIGGVDVPLQGAIPVCFGWGKGDDQLWRRGRGAIAGCRANFGGGAFDNTKIGFCYLGSMLV